MHFLLNNGLNKFNPIGQKTPCLISNFIDKLGQIPTFTAGFTTGHGCFRIGLVYSVLLLLLLKLIKTRT